MEDNITCTCNESCTCEDCECTEENKCSEECSCRDDCNCNEECHRKENCECHDEDSSEGINKLNIAYNKISELEDALLRSKADFINYRKRLEEEQTKLLKFCNESLIKDLLPIIDNFERAINMDDDNLEDEVSKFLSGFKMIYSNLLNTLKDFEVVEIDGVNKPFDATYHQAVLTEKVEGQEAGMVIEVLQKGYILKGKVIRPAMVKVSE